MRILLIFICSLTSLSLLYGQPVIAPLEHNPLQTEQFIKKKAYKLTAITDTIDLPFFEDFTTSSIVPDPSKWVENGGTFISNSYAVNPPNFNVATFDGLKANGSPYNSGNPAAMGLADNLTSLPIDLSVLDDGDLLHLRFYWQGETLGEPADTNVDSIRLQIKNRSGVWTTIWRQSDDSSGFNLQQNVISDSAQYFYKGFQFRFQNFGRLSGSFDVWNIDYILLDTGDLASFNWTPDYSFVTSPTSLLKNYTAMPFSQFRLTELADTVSVTLKSLNNKGSSNKVIDYNGQVINLTNGTKLDTIPFEDFPLGGGLSDIFKWKVDSNAFDNLPGESIIKYTFTFDSTADGDPKKDSIFHYYVPGDSLGKSRFDFQRNDSISGITYLTDYFAYDDGSAEYGFGVNQIQGKIAVKFELNEPDTLTHINIYFPRIGIDRTGEPISLRVWNSLQTGTSNATIVHGETVALSHSSDMNVFKSYKLDNPIIFTSPTVFYVGYQQSTNDVIYTGFDRNNDERGNIFFNINGIWHEYQSEAGAVMIRPVFRSQLITGTKKPKEELHATVFPNPSNGESFISGDVAEASIYDLSGRLVFTKTFDIHNHDIKSLDISSLPDGFYLLHLVNGEKKTVRKIILRR